MLGNILSVLIWIFSFDFYSFLLSRVVAGLTEGNVQLTISMLSDITGILKALQKFCLNVKQSFTKIILTSNKALQKNLFQSFLKRSYSMLFKKILFKANF